MLHNPYIKKVETVEVTPEEVTEFISGHLQPAEYLNNFKVLPPLATIGIGHTAIRAGDAIFELDKLERSVFHLLAINANCPTYSKIAAEMIVSEKKFTVRNLGIIASSLKKRINGATGQMIMKTQDNNAVLWRAYRFGAVNFVQDEPFKSDPWDEEKRLWFGQQIRAVLDPGHNR